MLDFNSRTTKALRASAGVNAAIDAALAETVEAPRRYLGASALGHDCLRKIQWDWTAPVAPEPRTRRIFARGHWCEDYVAGLLGIAGFHIIRAGNNLGFSQLGGQFQGHVDGIIAAGPALAGLDYPCLWENKGLGARGWTKLKNDGLVKAYPAYADQVALYQAYLGLTEHPALFTACNMDTMELLHLLVPFDPARAQAASDRAVQVVLATQASETLPRVTDNSDDWRCKYCAHRERCWADAVL